MVSAADIHTNRTRASSTEELTRDFTRKNGKPKFTPSFDPRPRNEPGFRLTLAGQDRYGKTGVCFAVRNATVSATERCREEDLALC